MAASLTIGSCALDTTGKVLTATISGGTGTGLSLSTVTGISPHLSGGNAYGFKVLSGSVSGTTLTLNLGTPIGSGETALLDFPSTVTLTDSGGNTPTGQTNVTVTNGSTTAVTTVLVSNSSSSFETTGLPWLFQGGTAYTGSMALATGLADFFIEFVADCTEVAVLAYTGGTTQVATDASTSLVTATGSGTQWAAKAATTAPLSAGKHLFRLKPDAGDYFFGVRLSGGNRTMHAVPTTKQTITPNTLRSYIGLPASTSVTPWGPWKDVSGGQGYVSTNYSGFRLEFGFTGTGVEVCTVAAPGNFWTRSVDGGLEPAPIAGGDATVNNVNGYSEIAVGLTAGAHTMRATLLGAATTTSTYHVRILNGSTLTASSAVSDTTVTVGSTTYLAVNDWVRIDKYGKREWRQITGISGTTVTLNTALSQAHAIGAQITSHSASAGSVSAWVSKDESAKRVVSMGDSNTQAANDYGNDSTTDANGVAYVLYDPRQSPIYLATEPLSIENVNLGIQGQTVVQMAARKADIATHGRSAFDYVTIWAGTNDVNGGGGATTTPTQFQSYVQQLVDASTPYLRTGGKVVLLPLGTPTGVTNSGGLNLATANAALQAVVAANPSTCVYASTLLDGVTAGDLRGVHYHTSGQIKIAANLAPYIGGLNVALLGSGFFAA